MSWPNRRVGAVRSETDGDKAPAEKLNGRDNIMDFSFGMLCLISHCVTEPHVYKLNTEAGIVNRT